MKHKIPRVELLLVFALRALICAGGESAAQEKPVVLSPYVVTGKSLAEAGFAFTARLEGRKKASKEAPIEAVVITRVDRRTPANKAGLKVGERIIQIGEVKLVGLSIARLQEEFGKKSKNGRIPLTIQSKDSEDVRRVELDFRSAPDGNPSTKEPNQSLQPTAPSGRG